MPRLISTRSLVTSLPSTTTPGVTPIARPHSRHVAVVEVAHLGILERTPAAEQDAPSAVLLVARHRLVEEVEQVVVHRHHALHELDVAHQTDVVVGEQLDGRGRADAAGIQRRRMDVTAFHEAEHLAVYRLTWSASR